MDEVSADQWSNGEFVYLKAVGQHLRISMASMIRKNHGPTAYHDIDENLETQPFPNESRLSSDLEDYKRLRKYRNLHANQERCLALMLEFQIVRSRQLGSGSGGGCASGARAPTPAQSQDDRRYPNQCLYHAGCRRIPRA